MRSKRFRKLSTAYFRFHKQLTALHEGKLRTVRNIASQARYDLEMKTNKRQLNFSFAK